MKKGGGSKKKPLFPKNYQGEGGDDALRRSGDERKIITPRNPRSTENPFIERCHEARRSQKNHRRRTRGSWKKRFHDDEGGGSPRFPAGNGMFNEGNRTKGAITLNFELESRCQMPQNRPAKCTKKKRTPQGKKKEKKITADREHGRKKKKREGEGREVALSLEERARIFSNRRIETWREKKKSSVFFSTVFRAKEKKKRTTEAALFLPWHRRLTKASGTNKKARKRERLTCRKKKREEERGHEVRFPRIIYIKKVKTTRGFFTKGREKPLARD